MKTILILIVAVLGIATITSCSSEKNVETAETNKLNTYSRALVVENNVAVPVYLSPIEQKVYKNGDTILIAPVPQTEVWGVEKITLADNPNAVLAVISQ